ncbi:hypothetical protein E7747_16330 (plasmid) [Duncaniella dubosii]|uniref:Uncharacterized protein n=1 Tax=Duncaniella dubosii TaxID=2518971 RepID=A0A4P7W6Q5_9BACT|nr:hypothetical protein [Duncaniella dubosii]QCD43811.1 hypothetical protein E7747_16330 [Duncaniella dubosii]
MFGLIVFAARTDFFNGCAACPAGWLPWACIIGISVIPTIVSLMTVAISIQCIGSVPVAILGALETHNRHHVGVLMFGEVLTVRAIIGIVLISAPS